jgi:transcriptional antiterminator Rof (Rho-off)
MRGEIISKEYHKMVFVHDKDGKEYACYAGDLKNIKKSEDLTDEEREKCTDLSTVLGDSW